MENLLRKLSKSGYKITPQRRLILEFLQHHRHQSADDICAALKAKEPNISLGTVYRNLTLLISLGVVNGLDFKDGRIRYEINDYHHHHLVCLGCGHTVEFPGCNLEAALKGTIDRNSFQVTGHSLEVFGYCPACQRAAGQQEGEI